MRRTPLARATASMGRECSDSDIASLKYQLNYRLMRTDRKRYQTFAPRVNRPRFTFTGTAVRFLTPHAFAKSVPRCQMSHVTPPPKVYLVLGLNQFEYRLGKRKRVASRHTASTRFFFLFSPHNVRSQEERTDIRFPKFCLHSR